MFATARLDYSRLIDRAHGSGLQPPPNYRKPADKLALLREVFFGYGVQYFVPVWLNSKKMAWRAPEKLRPVTFDTVERLVHQRHIDKRKSTLKYDLAIRTGVWKMPDRDRDRVLACFEVDNWEAVPEHLKDLVTAHPTLTVRTLRGFHFYYWVPKWYLKSGSNPGIADWQAKGRICVLTGADRYVLHQADIADLDEREAEALYNFASKPSQEKVQHQRWTPSWRAGQPGGQPRTSLADFEAFEGERNHRVNATLYYHRNKSDAETLELAQQLAAQCDPPYPYKEARDVAKSINRHKHRFPQACTPDEATGEKAVSVYHKDHHYTRLGMAYGRAGQRFTRSEYEAWLIEQGEWVRGRDGRIAVARDDIQHNLERGEIRVAGKCPSGPAGGRPALIYERMRDYQASTGHILPGKLTPKLMRVSAFLHLLTDQLTEVARKTMAAALGLESEATISQYAKELSEAGGKWGLPLIERQRQTPYIGTWALNPRCKTTREMGWPLPKEKYQALADEFVQYRPSLYRRTANYKKLVALGRGLAGNIHLKRMKAKHQRDEQQQDEAGKNGLPTFFRGKTTLKKDFTNSAGDVYQRQSHSLGNLLEKEAERVSRLFSGVDKGENIESTNRSGLPSYIYDDRTEKTSLRFASQDAKASHPKPCIYDEKIATTSGGYIHESQPQTATDASAGESASHAPPGYIFPIPQEGMATSPPDIFTLFQPLVVPERQLPEEELPGYPVNHYIDSSGLTLFDNMNWLLKRDVSMFTSRYSVEQILAWCEYRPDGTYWRDRLLYRCGQCQQWDKKFNALSNALRNNSGCWSCLVERVGQAPQVEIEAVIHQNNQPKPLRALFEKLFSDLPRRRRKDIEEALAQFPPGWVELAIHATRLQPASRFPWKYTLGILTRWQELGLPGEKQMRAIAAARSRHIIGGSYEDQAAFIWSKASAYKVFDLLIKPLVMTPPDERAALTALVQEYGEAEVKFAIEQAIKQGIYAMAYIVSIPRWRRHEKKTGKGI